MKLTKLLLSGVVASALAISCSPKEVMHVVTTESDSWIKATPALFEAEVPVVSLSFTIDTSEKGQEVDGFGGCFNELGWSSLSLLSEGDREGIIDELFAPGVGANFNICRMPVAANDFSLDWYSYNETKGDFAMENFSIDNDKQTLIPFIHAALERNADIKIWGSPWCPPSWMKYNQHYAMRTNDENLPEAYHNGLDKSKSGREGADMFIQEAEYMESYALYFAKYIEAYRAEGINVSMVMPQNEFNSDQIFPSCCWKANSLVTFIGEYLGPKMEELDVDIFFGTMERAAYEMVDTVMMNPVSSRYIKGAGFQWAGKHSVGEVHKRYPDMKLYQTEQECGDGKNNWKRVVYSWNLMKHYFDCGVSAYMYWNISLLEGGISRWGWAQNSLVVVDPEDNSYRFTNEYYLMKHISHFVQPGARYIKMADDFGGLVFENPDKRVVVLYMENQGESTSLDLTIGDREVSITLIPNSINTIVI
ncbi:MAG: beta-glycosidase [Rikenellaceae bacterium]